MEGVPTPKNQGSTTPGQAEALPPELRLLPWRDELIETHGFGPRSMYVETCWLPVLGPTATWLYRRLGSWAEHHPEGMTVVTSDLSRALGLGRGLSHSAAITRAVNRLVHFNAIERDGENLRARIALGPLTVRLASNLTPDLRRLHESYTRPTKPDWQGRS